jgi:hypothetical protein
MANSSRRPYGMIGGDPGPGQFRRRRGLRRGGSSGSRNRRIKPAAQFADPGRQIAKADEVEREAPAQNGFIPVYSGRSIYGVSQGLANTGARIFGTLLAERSGGRNDVRWRTTGIRAPEIAANLPAFLPVVPGPDAQSCVP